VVDLRSPLGLGTAPLGGLFSAVDEATARATVDRAWELGVRIFDTAPLYGSGLAEQRLGAALRARPRADYFLSTKVGRLLRPGTPDPLYHGVPPLAPVFDFSADGVRRSLEESLARLGLEQVDVALLHDPEDHMDAALAVVDTLREECPVGVGTNVVQTALRFAQETAIDRVLLAGRYTLLDQSALVDLLPLCLREGVGVIVGGVFNSGILADPSPGARFDYEQARQPELERAQRAASVCAAHGVPLPAAALQFALGHPAVLAVLTGVRSVAELEANVRFFDLDVPADVWAELVAQEIVSAAAPPPEAVHA
jgi:D-threo-aldose 1-dehydrogenase